MNFDLKTLELTAAATEKCDLLVVLVPEGFRPGQDALSVLAAHALKCGDLKAKVGTHLQLYLAPAVSARRVVLLGEATARPAPFARPCKPLRQLSSCLRSSER